MKSRRTDLDGFDTKILDHLQQDARRPLRQISELVHLSTAAVQRRIRRLEDIGIIDTVVAVLNPAKLGRYTTIIVEVTLESERIDLLEKTRKSFLACPQVQQCYYVTGETDFFLILTVETMEQYDEICQALFHDDSNVRRFRTVVCMKQVKSGLRIPVAALSDKPGGFTGGEALTG